MSKKVKPLHRVPKLPSVEDPRDKEVLAAALAVVETTNAEGIARERSIEARVACAEVMVRKGVKEVIVDDVSPAKRVRAVVTESASTTKIKVENANSGDADDAGDAE